MKLMIGLCAFLLFAAEPAKQKLTGTITDSMCAEADHSRMRMGPTPAECTLACVSAHDAMYVLYDGKQSWVLSDQRTPEKFAGKKVIVTGAADSKSGTIHVDSIVAASTK
jgi:Protein of unknown function (DUF5818)